MKLFNKNKKFSYSIIFGRDNKLKRIEISSGSLILQKVYPIFSKKADECGWVVQPFGYGISRIGLLEKYLGFRLTRD